MVAKWIKTEIAGLTKEQENNLVAKQLKKPKTERLIKKYQKNPDSVRDRLLIQAIKDRASEEFITLKKRFETPKGRVLFAPIIYWADNISNTNYWVYFVGFNKLRLACKKHPGKEVVLGLEFDNAGNTLEIYPYKELELDSATKKARRKELEKEFNLNKKTRKMLKKAYLQHQGQRQPPKSIPLKLENRVLVNADTGEPITDWNVVNKEGKNELDNVPRMPDFFGQEVETKIANAFSEKVDGILPGLPDYEYYFPLADRDGRFTTIVWRRSEYQLKMSKSWGSAKYLALTFWSDGYWRAVEDEVVFPVYGEEAALKSLKSTARIKSLWFGMKVAKVLIIGIV